MEQITIPNLATGAGRLAYQEYWYDLIIAQRNSVITSLWQLLRKAAFGSELRIVSTDMCYRVEHPLGPRLGFRVFMEEIVVRHYFNNVQALVYFGAVILLVFLGLRFADVLSEEVALIGIGIEALMLLTLFIVLFYSPDEEAAAARAAHEQDYGENVRHVVDSSEQQETMREVLHELEEIGGTYATVGMKLEQLVKSQETSLQELHERVERIQGLDSLESHAERLDSTNILLRQLVESIDAMSTRIDMLFGKELEFYVRQEFERIVNRDINNHTEALRATIEQQQPRAGK